MILYDFNTKKKVIKLHVNNYFVQNYLSLPGNDNVAMTTTGKYMPGIGAFLVIAITVDVFYPFTA